MRGLIFCLFELLFSASKNVGMTVMCNRCDVMNIMWRKAQTVPFEFYVTQYSLHHTYYTSLSCQHFPSTEQQLNQRHIIFITPFTRHCYANILQSTEQQLNQTEVISFLTV